MTAIEIVNQIREAGVKLRLAPDGQLQMQGSMPEGLRNLAREHRAEIAEVLRDRIKGPDALAGTWDCSHVIVAGYRWTLLTATDGRQICWRKDAWDAIHGDLGYKVSQHTAPVTGTKYTVTERQDGLAWLMKRNNKL